jgi:hypothetical protein
MGARHVLVLVLALAGVAMFASCGSAHRTTARQRVVDVTLDPSGRPYDVSLEHGARMFVRHLAVLHAPTRRVIFLGGEEALYVKDAERGHLLLADDPQRRYRVDAVWLAAPRDFPRIVGVVLRERRTSVVRWHQLQRVAYGTDAGMGAITTPEWAALPKGLDNPLSRLFDRYLKDGHRLSIVADVDGRPGSDTVLFDNGFGDGGFPSIAGYDARGRRAAIVLWTIVAPWRLAFPAGRPPSQVTRRENALADCLAGRRTIDGSQCRRTR